MKLRCTKKTVPFWGHPVFCLKGSTTNAINKSNGFIQGTP